MPICIGTAETVVKRFFEKMRNLRHEYASLRQRRSSAHPRPFDASLRQRAPACCLLKSASERSNKGLRTQNVVQLAQRDFSKLKIILMVFVFACKRSLINWGQMCILSFNLNNRPFHTYLLFSNVFDRESNFGPQEGRSRRIH